MRLEEKIALGIAVSLTILFGYYMLLDYYRVVLSITFSLLGLVGAGILLKDEKNWKWGGIFLFVICITCLLVLL